MEDAEDISGFEVRVRVHRSPQLSADEEKAKHWTLIPTPPARPAFEGRRPMTNSVSELANPIVRVRG